MHSYSDKYVDDCLHIIKTITEETAMLKKIIENLNQEIKAIQSNQSSENPIAWLRMRDGKPDWAEDCLSTNDDLCGYDAEDGYYMMPLYDHASPVKKIPVKDDWIEWKNPVDYPNLPSGTLVEYVLADGSGSIHPMNLLDWRHCEGEFYGLQDWCIVKYKVVG